MWSLPLILIKEHRCQARTNSCALEKGPWDVNDISCSSTIYLLKVLYLGYEVSSQYSVFTGHFGESQWDNIPKPLSLVDDSISVGQVGSILHSGLTRLSNHSVNLCLDFLWVRTQIQNIIQFKYHKSISTSIILRTDPVSLGSSSWIWGPSVKWWQRTLSQPQSSPGCKQSVWLCWSQQVDLPSSGSRKDCYVIILTAQLLWAMMTYELSIYWTEVSVIEFKGALLKIRKIIPSPPLPGKHLYNHGGHRGSIPPGASLFHLAGKLWFSRSWNGWSGEVLAGTWAD